MVRASSVTAAITPACSADEHSTRSTRDEATSPRSTYRL
jgi:hypothetical protein